MGISIIKGSSNSLGEQKKVRDGSRVKIRELHGHQILSFQLVSAEQAHADSRLLSVSSLMGSTLFGLTEGAIFEFRVTSGALKKFILIEVD